MRILLLAFLICILPKMAFADCTHGVTATINQSGDLFETDRERLLGDCNKYQKFLHEVHENNNTVGAYALIRDTFTCRKREHYVEIYNQILERGGKYETSYVNKFKSCRVIKYPKLTAVRKQKDPSSKIVAVVFGSDYSNFFLHSEWVHVDMLIPYQNFLDQRVE